ncbi:MAG: murein biosynthesis integral membrane protein MurJ [Clostridiales bacterium]|nr:murein biosynthesis integral membrane protein MurJ [Clostridiales bacterium]
MSDLKEKKKRSGKSMAIATALVMLGLLLSKGTGFVRELLVSVKYHEDLYRDAYSLAFTFPDFFFNLLIGGSIQAAITPSLAAKINENKEKEGLRAVSIFISVFAILMACVCSLGFIFSKQLFSVYAPSSATPEKIAIAAQGARPLYIQIFFMMLAALSIGILNAYKRFGSTSFGPTIYNICVLLSILIFAGDSSAKLTRCMIGITVAALVYFIFQFVVGFDKLSKIRFNFRPTDPAFIALLKRAIPILISASIVQVNILTLQRFALQMTDGTNFALRNAQTVWQLPYGIFAVAVGNVMLPSLAALYSSKQYKEASELLSSRLKTALFMTIPSAAFLFIMSNDTIRAFFKWNADFKDSNIEIGGSILMGFSFAIIAQTGVFMFNQSFYAIGKTRAPLFAGIVGMFTNPLFCWCFVKLGLGPISMGLAYSLSSIIQLMLLVWIYCSNKKLAPRNLLKFILKSIICVTTMILVMILLNSVLPQGDRKIIQLAILALKGCVSIAVYFSAACLLRMDEALFWIKRVLSKLGKKV